MIYESLLNATDTISDITGILSDYVFLPFFYFYTIKEMDKKIDLSDKIKELSDRYNSDKKDIKVIVDFFAYTNDINKNTLKDELKLAISNINDKKLLIKDLTEQKKFLEKTKDFSKYLPIQLINKKEKEINKINHVLKLWN